MKIVIRAGGTGSRLWPMSRQALPKQFQKVAGEKTMIRTTYERIKDLLINPGDLFISVNQHLFNTLQTEIPELGMKNAIIETTARNTGPAMCLEVCYLEKFCQPTDIVASLTSDDYMAEPVAFRELLQASAKFLKKHPEYIITPAVHPGYLDTGYTYMKIGKLLNDQSIYEVADVIEKPNEDRCQELIKSGIYYCHAGMYIWQLGTISKLFQQYQPEMYKICQQVVELMLEPSPDWSAISELYGQIEKMSIESAITEKADKIAMSVSDKVGWSDLGKWHIIKRILSKDKDNLTKGQVLYNNAKNSLVYNNVDKKLIVLNEVDDLVVVDTGDVLLISSLAKSAEVKKVVEELKKNNKLDYL